MIVEVTMDHIKRGEPKEENHCPIALALKEKTHRYVEVNDVEVLVYQTDGSYYEYALPKEAINFIRSFDTRKKVNPFRFRLPKGERSW